MLALRNLKVLKRHLVTYIVDLNIQTEKATLKSDVLMFCFVFLFFLCSCQRKYNFGKPCLVEKTKKEAL